MAQTSKIAVSLSSTLLERVERARHETGETRSAFVRRAVELALLADKEKALRARYLEGYRKHPETTKEVRAAEASAARLLAEEPWE